MTTTTILSDNGVSSGTAGIKTTGGNDGTLQLQTTTTGGTATTAVTIDTSQNVGIGVTPSAWGATFKAAQITNSMSLWAPSSGSAYYSNNVYFDGTNRKYVFTGAASEYVQSGGAHYFNSAVSGSAGATITVTTPMTIDTSGNLLVGTTGNNYGAIAAFSNATNNATIQAVGYFRSTQAGDVGMPGLYVMKYDNNSTTSQILVKFGMNNGASGQGQINGNGAGAAAFGSFSDARLKENIVDLPSQLNNIMALRPVEFDYIEAEGGGHQTGFIAQEMQAVYEDCVGERGDGMLTVTGWSKTEARLVKAIQEQQALITSLTERIAALENK